MPATAIRTVVITETTNPATLIGHPIGFTITGGTGKPISLSGQWETLNHQNLGGGHEGMGGSFTESHGAHTAAFMPYGTVVAFQ